MRRRSVALPLRCMAIAAIRTNRSPGKDTTDYDVREAMEEDDGIHLCRGIRSSLTLYLFHIADGWLANARA